MLLHFFIEYIHDGTSLTLHGIDVLIESRVLTRLYLLRCYSKLLPTRQDEKLQAFVGRYATT
jgi:hypothetical protein